MKLGRISFSITLFFASVGLANAATFGSVGIDDNSKGQHLAIQLNAQGVDYLNTWGGGRFVFGGTYSGTGVVFANTPNPGEANGVSVRLHVQSTTGGLFQFNAGKIGWFSEKDFTYRAGSYYTAGVSQLFGDLRSYFLFGDVLRTVGTVAAATVTIYNPTNGSNGRGQYDLHDYARMGQGVTPFYVAGTQPGTYDALGGSKVAAVPVPSAAFNLGGILLAGAGYFASRRRKSQKA